MVCCAGVMECSTYIRTKTNKKPRQYAHVLQASSLNPPRDSEGAKLHNDTQLGSLQTLELKAQLCALGGNYPVSGILEIFLFKWRPEAGRLS